MADIETAPTTAGPCETVWVEGREYVLLGTAHVSAESAAEVRAAIETGEYDRVAIELCAPRHQALTGGDELAEMDLFHVLRQGKAGMVAASLAIGAYQQRLADQLGVEPGAEMRAAISGCEARGLALDLIDREIGTTLKRVYRQIPWWQRLSMISGLLASVLSREKITSDDIEQLKEGDILESTFNEFAAHSADLHSALIDERDRYMAASLLAADTSAERTLVVVGAGHLKGLARYLRAGMAEPESVRNDLASAPRGAGWLRRLPWIVVAIIVTGFAIGFWKSPALGTQLVLEWIVINGTLSALGAALALAHPLTVLAAFVGAPLTSLNPTVGAGMTTAAAELWLRKPRVGDFATLRDNVKSVRGWWRNRVSRTLLVFLFSTIGSAVGTYVAGFRIVGQLFG